METKKTEVKTTVGQILYRTTFNFLQELESEKKITIKNFTELNRQSNTAKGLQQLKSLENGVAFLEVKKVDGNMIIKLLTTEPAKQVFAKLLRIGSNKFTASI